MCIHVLLGLVALCAPASTPITEVPKERKLKPTLMFSGTHSEIRKERFAVMTGEAEWKELWGQHRGKDFDPPFTERHQELSIDFDTHYVVAVFTGHDSCLRVTTFVRGEEVLLRIVMGFQTEGRAEDRRTAYQKAKDAAVADYCFVVLSKPVKTVAIEEDVRTRLDYPPLWKERRRFPVLTDKK
jgi:hypothetical protein